MKKKHRQGPETKSKPIIITNFIKFEDLRCMGKQIHQTPETDFKVQSKMMEMLIDTNNHGIDNFDRNEFWLYDVDTGKYFGGIEPTTPKPYYDHLREQGGHLFLLTKREDDKFFNPVSELICVWKVNNLPPSLNEIFEMVPEGFNGIEFLGEKFDPKNYSLLFIKKIN